MLWRAFKREGDREKKSKPDGMLGLSNMEHHG